jgi:phage shock protein C
MTCVRCGREIDADSVFCRFCGAAVDPVVHPARRLARLPAEGQIAGVCAGLAAYFGADVAWVRLLWVVLSIVPGAIIGGLVVYAIAWVIMPAQHAAVAVVPGKRLRRSATDVQIAGVCAGIAEYLNADPTVVRLVWAILSVFLGAVVLGVVAYVIAWMSMPPGIAPPLQTAPSTPTAII